MSGKEVLEEYQAFYEWKLKKRAARMLKAHESTRNNIFGNGRFGVNAFKKERWVLW